MPPIGSPVRSWSRTSSSHWLHRSRVVPMGPSWTLNDAAQAQETLDALVADHAPGDRVETLVALWRPCRGDRAESRKDRHAGLIVMPLSIDRASGARGLGDLSECSACKLAACWHLPGRSSAAVPALQTHLSTAREHFALAQRH